MGNLLKNKEGREILSAFWIIAVSVIAMGIYAMVYLFHSAPYDIREVEAGLLLNRIADCISYAGKINEEILADGRFKELNFAEECHLTFSAESWEDEQFYAAADFYKIDDAENRVHSIVLGKANLVADCEIQKIAEGDYHLLPQCREGKFYAADAEGNGYVIRILTAVRKTEKNTKL